MEKSEHNKWQKKSGSKIFKSTKAEAKYSNELFLDIDRGTLDNEEIACQINNLFVNIGKNLSNSMDHGPGT